MDAKDLTDLVGAVAGTLTTVAFLPQVVKALRSHSTRDLSLTMFVTFCSGVGLWLVYGILMDAWPVIVANSVTLLLSGIILILKIQGVRSHRP